MSQAQHESMPEQPDQDGQEPVRPPAGSPDPAGPGDSLRTGDPSVDEVLDSLATLDGVPVEAHVEVFERAHDQLRRALDGGADVLPVDGADPAQTTVAPERDSSGPSAGG